MSPAKCHVGVYQLLCLNEKKGKEKKKRAMHLTFLVTTIVYNDIQWNSEF